MAQTKYLNPQSTRSPSICSSSYFLLSPGSLDFLHLAFLVNQPITPTMSDTTGDSPPGWLATVPQDCRSRSQRRVSALEAINAVEVIDLTEDATEAIHLTNKPTNGVTEVIDLTEDATEVVDLTEDATKVADLTEDATKVIDLTEDATKVIDLTEDATKVIDLTEDATKVIDLTEDALPMTPQLSINGLPAPGALTSLPSTCGVFEAINAAEATDITTERVPNTTINLAGISNLDNGHQEGISNVGSLNRSRVPQKRGRSPPSQHSPELSPGPSPKRGKRETIPSQADSF